MFLYYVTIFTPSLLAGIIKVLYHLLHDFLSQEVYQGVNVKKVRSAILRQFNEAVMSLNEILPSKMGIDRSRLVTCGKDRNEYFQLEMRLVGVRILISIVDQYILVN
jgi:hypothetical protein